MMACDVPLEVRKTKNQIAPNTSDPQHSIDIEVKSIELFCGLGPLRYYEFVVILQYCIAVYLLTSYKSIRLLLAWL